MGGKEPLKTVCFLISAGPFPVVFLIALWRSYEYIFCISTVSKVRRKPVVPRCP